MQCFYKVKVFYAVGTVKNVKSGLSVDSGRFLPRNWRFMKETYVQPI